MATVDPADIPTPDDSGSDAFERFRYQAMIAVPFCVDCGLGGRTLSIIAEHIEDVAIQLDDSWRFIQVKTRDLQRGPWRISHLLTDSGALRSLLRSHRALSGVPCTLEAFLEGPVDRKDPLSRFDDRGSPEFLECVEQIRTKLGLDGGELKSFIERVRVRPNLPHREYVQSYNLDFLGRAAPDVTSADLRSIHQELVEAICAAMAGNQTFVHYPRSVVDPESVPTGSRATVEGKRLTRDRLREMCARLAEKPRPLIARMVAPELGQPSVLEQKLIAGGASQQIVVDAKELRANAAMQKFKLLAIGGLDDEIEDVRQSLRLRANSQVALHEDKPRPAREIWDGLFQILTQQASAIDPKNHFGRAEFLLGEVCDLADECTTNWGVASAI